ncbi:hypothetical protein PHET_05435 [Paragonimus heterotremus]|uniref:Uncharacterized protein n=1 Tax=Paragonimus heterotremus TaxID=100268 RepID=A0A8J4T8B0_9TREM|nr:hypothetical protein PHET_05435 [Paragonimus heterotremus]
MGTRSSCSFCIFENKFCGGGVYQTSRLCASSCEAYNVKNLSERICCLTNLCNFDIDRARSGQLGEGKLW